MKILNSAIEELDGDMIPGEVVFKLYDTYGFPLDLTADIARENNLTIDKAGFEIEMDQQRKRARSAGKFGADYNDKLDVSGETVFSGYDKTQDTVEVEALFIDGQKVKTLRQDDVAQIVLKITPFYAESGGPVGDTGTLNCNGNIFEVQDTQKQGSVFIHHGVMINGSSGCG